MKPIDVRSISVANMRLDGVSRAMRGLARKGRLLLAAAAAVCATGAGAACPATAAAKVAAPVPPEAAAQLVLVKNWDFCHLIRNQEQLRAEFFTRYVYALGKLDFLNDEWERYRDMQNHVFGPEGLSLVARLPDTGIEKNAIESGMLRSKWVGKYGYYEARVRVPKGRGAWPAFWLNPQDMKWPPEIDVFEIVNNGRDTPLRSFHILHNGDKTRPTTTFTLMGPQRFYVPGFDYSDGFHTFAVLWTPTEVTHFVDGKKIEESPFVWTHRDGSDAGPAHVLLNLAVGGSWPGPPQDVADFPMKLDVEYIRVWQSAADSGGTTP